MSSLVGLLVSHDFGNEGKDTCPFVEKERRERKKTPLSFEFSKCHLKTRMTFCNTYIITWE